MLRLFVGLALPEGVIARLAMLCSGLPGASWVEPANMHITLRFIGEGAKARAILGGRDAVTGARAPPGQGRDGLRAGRPPA